MVKILDLRKKSGENNQAPTTKNRSQPKEVTSPAKNPSQISWEAPSFYFNPRGNYIYPLVIALSMSGAAMLLFHKDTLTAIFLLLSSLVIVLYSTKKPEISKIVVNRTGISIGEEIYYYKDFRSFWIHYDPGTVKELSLESKKWYIPYIKISIDNTSPLIIRSLLINFLPEKEHENSLIDIISRKIGI